MPNRPKLKLPWNIEKELELAYSYREDQDHGVSTFKDENGEPTKSEWWKFAIKESGDDQVKTLFVNGKKTAEYIINNFDQGDIFRAERYKPGDEAFRWKIDDQFIDELETNKSSKPKPKTESTPKAQKTPSPNNRNMLKNRSIEYQCSLKAVTELAVAGLVKIEDMNNTAKEFAEQMPCHRYWTSYENTNPGPDGIEGELKRLDISQEELEKVVQIKAGEKISDLSQKSLDALISRLQGLENKDDFKKWENKVMKEDVIESIKKWKEEEKIKAPDFVNMMEVLGHDSLEDMKLDELKKLGDTVLKMRKEDFTHYVNTLIKEEVEEEEEAIPF